MSRRRAAGRWRAGSTQTILFILHERSVLESSDLKSWKDFDCRFTNADLTGANLRRADLIGANLSGPNLMIVKLHGAKLNGAHLTGANLSGANLNGANLNGANLNGANLNGANFVNTYCKAATIWSEGINQPVVDGR
ncbi:pentapeptide repeat-containing protein [Rhodococcus globerulus]|nr:pentapeptide repeat-containing protein [Rhodococcus globerulus]